MKLLHGKFRVIVPLIAVLMVLTVVAFDAQLIPGNLQKNETSDQGEGLNWIGFDEGFTKAAKEKKMLLVDVFAVWCEPCKMMDEHVYTDKSVIDFINKHYVPIKVDGESQDKIKYKDKTFTKQEWALNMGIMAYPTTIFFKSNGELISGLPGYVEAPIFRNILEYVTTDAIEKNISFEDWIKKKGGEK